MRLLLAILLIPQQTGTSISLNGQENLEVMVILLKLVQVDKDMRPLQEQLQVLSAQQQLLIRQLRDFENKAIADRSLPRAEWFFSSTTRTLEKVGQPTPRPVR